MKVKGIIYICICGVLIAFRVLPILAGELYPTNAVFFYNYDGIKDIYNLTENRQDWWADNYRVSDKTRSARCYIGEFHAPCRRVLSVGQIFNVRTRGGRDNAHQFEADLRRAHQPQKRSAADQLSLYEQPIPFTPIFAPLFTNVTGPARPFPVATLNSMTEQMTFKKSIEVANAVPNADFYQLMAWQPVLNLSFEDVNINEALRIGYDYWSRAPDQEPTVCTAETKESHHPGDPCITVVRLVSAKSPIEPPNFVDGVAVCFTASEARSFLYHCSLMAFETSNKKRYVKAIVGPNIPFGGGAFADDFGEFAIECALPITAVKAVLMRIKSDFGLEGKFSVDGGIDIRAESGFHRFDEVGKYGLVSLRRVDVFQREGEAESLTQIAFNWMGKWWNQNRNDRTMPTFDDEDVKEFKKILERVVGEKNACNILTRSTKAQP
jgi:hypothetical protein